MLQQRVGLSSLSKKHQINQLHSSGGAPPTTVRRTKREYEGLGEDPPGSPMTHEQVIRTCRTGQPRFVQTTQGGERCISSKAPGKIWRLGGCNEGISVAAARQMYLSCVLPMDGIWTRNVVYWKTTESDLNTHIKEFRTGS